MKKGTARIKRISHLAWDKRISIMKDRIIKAFMQAGRQKMKYSTLYLKVFEGMEEDCQAFDEASHQLHNECVIHYLESKDMFMIFDEELSRGLKMIMIDAVNAELMGVGRDAEKRIDTYRARLGNP